MMDISQFEFWLITAGIVLLVSVIGILIKAMHGQAMTKFDMLIGQVSKMATTMAVHDEKLLTGSEEFNKIADHQKIQDKDINDLDHRLTILETKSETV